MRKTFGSRLAIGASIIIAASLNLATATSAADLSVYKSSTKTAPAPFSWSGLYLGANIGWGRNSSAFDLTADGASQPLASTDPDRIAFFSNGDGTIRGDGVIGGLHAGYNFQHRQFLFGFEADLTFGELSGSRSTDWIRFLLTNNSFTFSDSSDVDWLATLRPRIGLAFDRLAIFATGGLALGHVEAHASMTGRDDNTGTIVYRSTGSASTTRVGWTVGGGLEYRFGANWSARADYLYVDLGSLKFTSSDPAALNAVEPIWERISVDTRLHLIRGGLSYHF